MLPTIEREKLIDLIKNSATVATVNNGEFIETTLNTEEIADFLLENGVKVSPIETAVEEVRRNAIREFANRLTDKKHYSEDMNEMVVLEKDIDRLVKETECRNG